MDFEYQQACELRRVAACHRRSAEVLLRASEQLLHEAAGVLEVCQSSYKKHLLDVVGVEVRYIQGALIQIDDLQERLDVMSQARDDTEPSSDDAEVG